MLGSACFLLQLIGEDVLHDNVELVLIKNIGKLFSGSLRMPPAASELGFALCNFSEVL
jgi:hypothetical protein